jgi:hypothetical protein
MWLFTVLYSSETHNLLLVGNREISLDIETLLEEFLDTQV